MARIEALLSQLQRANAIALDTSVFIYVFEQHPDFGLLAQGIFRAIENGVCRGYASVLALGEVLTGVKKAGNRDLLLRYRNAFQQFPGLTLCACDIAVMEMMSDLRSHYNIRTPDAIHIGSALVQGAYTFVTNDAQLKCITELDIAVLTDFA
ncbi:MAG: type II toxin-antitoxin system VapC family toxin [Anaerolineae bacterium]